MVGSEAQVAPRNESKDATLGELSARWAMLAKITLTCTPLLMGALTPWAVWITSEAFASRAFRGLGDRFTTSDAKELELEIERKRNTIHHELIDRIEAERARVELMMKGYPTDDRYRELERRFALVEANQRTLEANQTIMQATLMRIESAVAPRQTQNRTPTTPAPKTP